MRIVGITGVLTTSPHSAMWMHLQQSFARHFPRSSFFVEHLFYLPWEIYKMRSFANYIVDKYDDGEDELLLLGYSMGGVLARNVAGSLRKTRVNTIVTIFSPHMLWGSWFSTMLGAPQYDSVPLLSFQARNDCVVWWGSRPRHSSSHYVIDSSHYLSLLQPHVAEKIAHIVAKNHRKDRS